MLVPIARRHTFEEVREFAGSVAGAGTLATGGARAAAEWSERKRRGVLVDANQNGAGQREPDGVLGAFRGQATVSTHARLGTK